MNCEPLSKAERAELMAYLRESAEIERRENRALQSRPGGLIEFVRYFWDVLEPAAELVDGWPLEAICEHLEAVTLGKITRLLINVPPGFMKSMLCNVFWPAWVWSAMDMPAKRFVTFSYAAHLTERDNGRFRDLVVSRKFRELWGHRFKITEEGKVRVANDKMGWKFASSVGGVGTGERGDVVILDDALKVDEGESEVVREATTRWFREAMSNRLNSEDSSIVVIGQRVHEADVPGVILEEYPDYEFLCIPMEYEPAIARRTSIGWEDPREEAGELAWPERFSDGKLQEFRRQRYLWASQYQQSPHIRGGAIIQDSWWRLWDADEALEQGCAPGRFPPFDYVIGCVDGAFTEKTSNDPSAMTVWGAWQDRTGHTRFMLVYAWSERLEFHGIPENADGSPGTGPDGKPGKLGLVLKVAKTARKYKIDRLLIENKASGISVAQEMRRLYAATEDWAIHLVDPKGMDKVQRLNSVAAFWEVGLIYAPNTRWAEMVIREVASFPKGKNDDLTDTCAMALTHLRLVGMARMPEEARLEIEGEMTHKKVDHRPLYPG